MDDIPFSSLSIRGTEVALGLNLYQCPEIVLRIKGEDFGALIDRGGWVAGQVDWELARHATQNEHAFSYMREKLRGTLVSTCHGKLGEPTKALSIAMLWLTLNEPLRRRTLREAMAECLMSRRAVVQIACGRKMAYAVAIGVNARDMQPLVKMAENSTAPSTITYGSRTPTTTMH